MSLLFYGTDRGCGEFISADGASGRVLAGIVIGYNCSLLNYSAVIGGQGEVTAAAVKTDGDYHFEIFESNWS